MVTLLGLLDTGQVFLQLRSLCIGNTVNSREHLVFLIASPVSTCQAGKLEGFYRFGGHQVRACTQIYILALSIEADLCILRQILDELYLVRLLLLLHELNGLISRQGEALQSQVLFHDLLHLCFQSGQIICGKGIRTVKVIVKALCDRRTDGQLRLREQTLHCLCQNVGCGMPECSLSLLVIKGMQHQGAVLVDHGTDVHALAVYGCCTDISCKSFADIFCDINDSHGLSIFADTSIFQCYFHFKNLLSFL